MSTIAAIPRPAAADIRRITVGEYEAMIDAGIFADGEKIDLIEGMLVRKMTKKRRHTAGSAMVRRAIERVLPGGWHAESEAPIRLANRDTLHEPDVSVIRGRIEDYLDLDPGPPDVALVVEVSYTSVKKDRKLAATYLAGGVPAFWLVNLPDRRLEIYTNDPRMPTIVDASGHADLVLDGQAVCRIAVADLLPDAS